ncbi:MAG: hypothetical protein QM804_06685 [Propionicimonas sp.]
MGDEFGIYYQPEAVAAKVARARSKLLWRLGSMVVFILIGLGVRFAYPEQFGSSALWFVGSVLVFGLILGSWEIVQLFAARSDARRVTPGLALGANRAGLLVGPEWFGWGEVGGLVVRPGRWGGSSRLVATGRDQRSREILLDYTGVLPGTLDSAIVALSGGRARVDLSRLDA